MLHEQELASAKFLSQDVQDEAIREAPVEPLSKRALRFVTESKLLVAVLVGIPVVALVLMGGLGGSDRANFDRLSIGMSRGEVQAIVRPKTGKWGPLVRDLDDNVNLSINNNMVLTIRDGRLIDKQWIGREAKPSRNEGRQR